MRIIFSTSILFSIILISCTPSIEQIILTATPLSDSSPASTIISPSLTPADEITPEPSLTPVSTVTPTQIPDMQVSDLILPDPRFAAPELFDLNEQGSPISQFVSSLKMTQMEISTTQVLDNLVYRQGLNTDGSPFVVGLYTIEAGESDQREFLMGDFPLIIAVKENDVWKWNPLTPSNLGEQLGVFVGTMSQPPGTSGEIEKTEGQFHELKKGRFNRIVTITDIWQAREKKEGIVNWGYIDLEIDEAFDLGAEVIRINALLSNSNPAWLETKTSSELEEIILTHIQEHMEYFYNRILDESIKRGVSELTIEFNVVNEPWHGNLISEKLGRDIWVPMAFQKAISVRNDFFNIQKSEGPRIIIKLGLSHAESHYVEGEGHKQTIELLELLANQNIKIDYVDLHGHEKDSSNLVSLDSIAQAINRIKKLPSANGDPIEVVIGEYDFSIAKWKDDPDRFQKQAQRYYDVLRTVINAGVKEFTLWGVVDSESWFEHDIDEEYLSLDADALVFTDDGLPKPSYYAILKALWDDYLEKTNNTTQ